MTCFSSSGLSPPGVSRPVGILIGGMWTAMVLPLFFVLPASAQLNFTPLREIGNERARVVFSATAVVEEAQAQRLIAALESQAPLPGLPANVLSGRTITISLALQGLPGREAWSFESQSIIALPLEGVFGWQDGKLHRVIRHELAHLGLSAFLGSARTPVWFREGFAEWVAGGLSCEGEVRIRLDLTTRRFQGDPPPRFTVPAAPRESRLSYDLFTTVFEYVDGRTRGAVQNGTLLREVRMRGLELGVERVVGIELSELELDWQSFLAQHYGGPLDDISCDPSRQ